jgi:hypothetical protein
MCPGYTQIIPNHNTRHQGITVSMFTSSITEIKDSLEIKFLHSTQGILYSIICGADSLTSM